MSSSASGAASPESGGDVPYTVPLRDTAQSALEASASAGAAGSLHAFGSHREAITRQFEELRELHQVLYNQQEALHESFQQFKVPERGTEQGDEDSFLKQFPSAFLAEAQQFKNMVEATERLGQHMNSMHETARSVASDLHSRPWHATATLSPDASLDQWAAGVAPAVGAELPGDLQYTGSSLPALPTPAASQAPSISSPASPVSASAALAARGGASGSPAPLRSSRSTRSAGQPQPRSDLRQLRQGRSTASVHSSRRQGRSRGGGDP